MYAKQDNKLKTLLDYKLKQFVQGKQLTFATRSQTNPASEKMLSCWAWRCVFSFSWGHPYFWITRQPLEIVHTIFLPRLIWHCVYDNGCWRESAALTAAPPQGQASVAPTTGKVSGRRGQAWVQLCQPSPAVKCLENALVHGGMVLTPIPPPPSSTEQFTSVHLSVQL